MVIPEADGDEEVDEPFEKIYYRVHEEIVKNPARAKKQAKKLTKHNVVRE